MSKSLIDLIKNYIENKIESNNLVFGENLFINYYPDSPNLILSIIDMGGYPPAQYFKTREKIIEFKFRAKTHAQGVELGNEIFELFHDKENYYLEDKRIMHSYVRTDVSHLYRDNDEREEFSLEIVFLIER